MNNEFLFFYDDHEIQYAKIDQIKNDEKHDADEP